MSLLHKFMGYFKKNGSPDSNIDDFQLPYEAEGIDEEIMLQNEGKDLGEEEEYEIVEREFLPAKRICPDCGGITLEGLDFCDKCGGEL